MFIILEHLGDDIAIEADDILRLKRGREPGTFRPLVEVLGYSEATGLFKDYTFGTLEEVTERVNAARSKPQKRTQTSSKPRRNPAKDIHPTPIPTPAEKKDAKRRHKTPRACDIVKLRDRTT